MFLAFFLLYWGSFSEISLYFLGGGGVRGQAPDVLVVAQHQSVHLQVLHVTGVRDESEENLHDAICGCTNVNIRRP